MSALLELSGVSMRFGGLVALERLDFAVEAGAIVAMIGPNGAGKSTVFNLITGIYRPAAGRISFAGRDITGRPTDAIAAIQGDDSIDAQRLRADIYWAASDWPNAGKAVNVLLAPIQASAAKIGNRDAVEVESAFAAEIWAIAGDNPEAGSVV